MDAVTYPDQVVSDFINRNYVPLKIPFNAKPLSRDFNIKWTPTLITLDAEGQEHHRSVGYLAPDAFIASALLGIGKYHFDHDHYQDALHFFEKVISDYADGDYTPEAIYFRGISRYKNTKSRTHLKETYETLNSRYPDNEWTKKAYPYHLI
ncbi:MAG: hypothetical protein ACWGOD_02920 [Desulfobulbales bacterium]